MTGKGKKLWVAAALILLAGILCACTQKASQEDQRLLLDHMERYLAVTEDIQTQMLTLLDYVEEFSEDNSWDSLLKAKAACFSAKRYLRELKLPEFTLTDSQYEALIEAGIEADVVRKDYSGLEEEREACMDTVNLVTQMLQADVFLSANVSMFPQWIESRKAAAASTLEYTCLTVNYLLLQLDDHGLWEKMPEAYPCISEKQAAWDDDPSSLVAKCAEVLDQYEEYISGTVAYAAASKYTLSIVEEAISTGELEQLAKQLHTIEGVPGYIPMPYWLPEDSEIFYCVDDSGTGELRLVEAGEIITQAPSVCYISCGRIPQEDVKEYLKVLDQLGYAIHTDGSQDDSAYSALVMRDAALALFVEWTQEDTALYLREPIRCLIPELYFAAMLQK